MNKNKYQIQDERSIQGQILAEYHELDQHSGPTHTEELIWQQALASESPHEHSHLAYPLNGLAILYREQGKYREAEPLYQRALHIREQTFGAEHPDVAYSLNNLAILY